MNAALPARTLTTTFLLAITLDTCVESFLIRSPLAEERSLSNILI